MQGLADEMVDLRDFERSEFGNEALRYLAIYIFIVMPSLAKNRQLETVIVRKHGY